MISLTGEIMILPSGLNARMGFGLSLAVVISAGCNSRPTEVESETEAARQLTAPANEVGAWDPVLVPPDHSKNVNPVHSIMLPSGNILMVGGSSNRNLKGERGVEVDRPEKLILVDNASIFNPVAKSWTRVPGLPASIKANFATAIKKGVDAFCGGHILMPNGKVLMAGGTLSYQSNFQGARFLWEFDESSQAWTELPSMAEGRWYPTVLQLPDGKIGIISGLNGGSTRTISDMFDIYDPKTNRVKSVDLKKAPGYPYGNGNLLEHYPRILPLNNGKFLVTGDGSGMGPTTRKKTSFMTVTPEGNVSFQAGPDRPLVKRLYGTALVDPNSPAGDVLLLGGMPGVGDPGSVTPLSNATTPTLTAMERYNATSNSWATEAQFLGKTKDESRTGHYAIILPTGQFLVINGSNYIQNRGTYNPLLFTSAGERKYTSKEMQRAQFPRFYHNVALLLPDGRVWVNGSNRDRATVSLDGKVEQGNVTPGAGSDPNFKNTDGKFIPAGSIIEREFTRVEIFSPPYLFDSAGKRIPDSDRPTVTEFPKTLPYGAKGVRLRVKGSGPGGKVNLVKLGSATHAWDNGQKFVPLTVAHNENEEVQLNIPDNTSLLLPGHYFLFYVSKSGVPSVGVTVLVEPK
jgi:hypothetical protein